MKKYCQADIAKEMAVGIVYQDLGYDDEDKFDSFISSIIDRASRFIDRATNRPDDFFNGGVAITEYKDGKEDQSRVLYSDSERAAIQDEARRTYFLMHQPVLTVTSISKNIAQLGSADSWSTITKYRLNLTSGRLVIASGSAPSQGIDNLKIVYTAGFAAVPTDIKFACEELTANQLKALIQQGMAAKVRFAQPTLINFSNPKIFTDGIKEQLSPYISRRI
jgi:hypothetical protein